MKIDHDKSILRIGIKLLNRFEKIRLIFILLLTLLGVLLESLSLGLVVPVIGFLTQDDPLKNYDGLEKLLGNPSSQELAVFGLIALSFFYVLKTVAILWITWLQKSFSATVNTRIAHDMYKSYLESNYSFFLRSNSAELIKNIQGSNGLMFGTLEPGLMIASDGLVTLSIILFLILLEPVGASATLVVFVICSWIIRGFSSKRISRWAGELNQCRSGVIKSMSHGFGGIKEIQIAGREVHFVSDFDKHYMQSLEIQKKFSFIQIIPRAGLELVAIVGMAVLVVVMIAMGKQTTEVLPVLGLFGVAAFRIVPALNRFITNFQTIGLARPQVLDTYDALKNFSSSRKTPGSLGEFNDFVAEGITFVYENSEKVVLDRVSLSVSAGEAVGFVGQSGSGKSTLVDIMLGLLQPQSGSVLINGQDISQVKSAWQKSIGYIPQTIFLMDDSLRRNIAIGIADKEIDEAAIVEALNSAQLSDFVASLPDGLDTVVGERGVRLSGGQRQRIGIARALYHRPSVLVLDEATSSLDTETEKGVMQAVQALQGDKTVIIVAHRLSTVEYCDRLYRLDAGRIVDEGTFDEVMNRSQS
jgi:ABC-type multidrug transport system fused ATPase/permease subunit